MFDRVWPFASQFLERFCINIEYDSQLQQKVKHLVLINIWLMIICFTKIFRCLRQYCLYYQWVLGTLWIISMEVSTPWSCGIIFFSKIIANSWLFFYNTDCKHVVPTFPNEWAAVVFVILLFERKTTGPFENSPLTIGTIVSEI